MSKDMLHIRNPGRWDNVAAIIGDRRALEALQRAVDTALATGSGGAFLFSSDGEGYALAVAMEDNMEVVETAYAGELKPARSLRERVPMYAVQNFGVALRKAVLMLTKTKKATQCPDAMYRSANVNQSELGGVK